MRFVSFEHQGKASYGVWKDASSWWQAPAEFQARHPDLKSVIAAGQLEALEQAARAAGRLLSAAECHLLPVIPNPGKVFCVGLNYKTHVAEMKRADSEHPAIFTRFADSLAAHNALTLETRLNGQVMQRASLSDLIFTLPVIIEYLSGFTPLSPGDVIATGTPGGVGDKREPPVYMKSGDVIEVQITDLGTLRNVVADEA